MDRGAWQAIVHGVVRVGHDLATKLPSNIVPCANRVGPCCLSIL